MGEEREHYCEICGEKFYGTRSSIGYICEACKPNRGYRPDLHGHKTMPIPNKRPKYKKPKLHPLDVMALEADFMGMSYGYWAVYSEAERKQKVRQKLNELGLEGIEYSGGILTY